MPKEGPANPQRHSSFKVIMKTAGVPYRFLLETGCNELIRTQVGGEWLLQSLGQERGSWRYPASCNLPILTLSFKKCGGAGLSLLGDRVSGVQTDPKAAFAKVEVGGA